MFSQFTSNSMALLSYIIVNNHLTDWDENKRITKNQIKRQKLNFVYFFIFIFEILKLKWLIVSDGLDIQTFLTSENSRNTADHRQSNYFCFSFLLFGKQLWWSFL